MNFIQQTKHILKIAALFLCYTGICEATGIKIGFCKGRQSKMAFKLLDYIGIHVYKNLLPRSTNFLVKSNLHPNIQLIEIKSDDMSTFLDNSMVDIAICYDNVIPKNIESKFIKLEKQGGIHPVKVVVVKRKGEVIPKVPTIFSEFPDLTQEWVKKRYPNAKVIHVHGGAETFLANRMCDLAVTVKDRGDTIKINNLEVCDHLSDADLYIYVSPCIQEKYPKIVRVIRNSLQDEIIYFYEVDTKYGFLSNFYPAEFQTEEGGNKEVWRTAEHYYHAHKFEPSGELYDKIKNTKTAKPYHLAHRHADKVRQDWEQVKETIMQKAIFYKFSQNPDLKQKLLETGDRQLAEHSMKDYYWAIGADGSGKNRLGKLLMQLREKLDSPKNVVEQALRVKLLAVDTKVQEEASNITSKASKKFKEGANYKKGLKIVLEGLKKVPRSFELQLMFAWMIGDYSGNFSSPFKGKMIKRSKEIFEKLRGETKGQPKGVMTPFKNEYYYRFAKYKDQYKLGLERVADYRDTEEWFTKGFRGYYSQGVGAANYAKELLLSGNKELAMDYAQKAIIAWGQYFSYRNDYYNSYVHYAMALGILSYKKEMMKALKHAASLIKRDLNFFEFREVIEFIDEVEKGKHK